MMSIPNITLNDGVKIPVYGFGTYQIPADGSTYKAVREALDLGIRHIDTAVAYFNEQEVGHAIRESGIPREEISSPASSGFRTTAMRPLRRALRPRCGSWDWTIWICT